jgi:hypothetical protein
LVGVTAVMMMIMKMIMGLVVVSAGARPTPWLLWLWWRALWELGLE